MTWALLLSAFAVAPAGAADEPRIQPGAIEVGLSGAWTSVEKTSTADVGVHGGWFFALGPGVSSAELGVGYRRISSLSEYDVETNLDWSYGLRDVPIYPYLAIGFGVRHETIGSFSETRYPAGGTLGVRVLAGTMAGGRVEFRYRRVLDDPVADFDETQLRVGLSLYLRNAPARDARAR